MDQGFQFFDLIFLALVAGFVILRLRSVLGRRTGKEDEHRDSYQRRTPLPQEEAEDNDNVIPLPRSGRAQAADPVDSLDALVKDDLTRSGVARIRIADPSFDPNRFLGGARMAFEMIVDAYAKGDVEALRPLLADDVFSGFESAIRGRQAANQTMETQIAAIKSVDLVGADMQGTTALVTVRFITEQMTLVKDSEGRILEGDPTRYDTVVDDWTFARNTSSDDPNWQLVTTATPEGDDDAEV